MNTEYPSKEEWVRDFWRFLAESMDVDENDIELDSQESPYDFGEE